MTDKFAQYLHQIELKNSIPKEMERLKRRELEINLYLFLFGVFAVSAYFYPQLYNVGHTDNRLLLLVMLVWFYFQFEYKYYIACYDLTAKIKRRNSLNKSLDLEQEEVIVSAKNENKGIRESSPYMHKAYNSFIIN